MDHRLKHLTLQLHSISWISVMPTVEEIVGVQRHEKLVCEDFCTGNLAEKVLGNAVEIIVLFKYDLAVHFQYTYLTYSRTRIQYT